MLPVNYKKVWIIRFLIIDPALIFVYLLSYNHKFINRARNLLRILLILGQIGIISMVYIADVNEEAYWAYYAGLILVILWSGFIFRFKLFETILFFISTIIFYNIVAIFFQKLLCYSIHSKEFAWFLGNNFFLISASLLAIIGAYYLEKYKKEIKEENQRYIIAKEKAEKSDLLKTAFLTNMSHEIRTPLNGLMGFSKLLANDNISIEKKIAYSNNIHKSGNQLVNIIDNILEISRIQTGQINLIKSKFSINQILIELYENYNPLANKKEIELKIIQKLNDNRQFVYSDKLRLLEVLHSILDNAIKFTKNGHIYIGVEQINDFLQFSIEDTGIGIDQEALTSIFNKFVQEEIELTRNYGGIGLGLTIAKSLIELLGGKISAKSIKDKGSTFYVTLPI
jgi:signal transduction histidine kinase